jgi:hypothetical protein
VQKVYEKKGDALELIGLPGRQLSAVTFVQDYLQLHFDGPTINAITLPVVHIGNNQIRFGTPGYRDELCDRIGKLVVRAYVLPDDRLQIDISDQSSIVISLRARDYRAAEAVIFFADDTRGDWASW